MLLVKTSRIKAAGHALNTNQSTDTREGGARRLMMLTETNLIKKAGNAHNIAAK